MHEAVLYSLAGRLSIKVIDFQSALDGIVAYTILFSLLFLSSFANAPTAGLLEVYRNSLLMAGLAAACALAIIYVYARSVGKSEFRFGLDNAKESVLTSLTALVIWATAWILFGEFSGTYHLALERVRLGLVPLALVVGLLDGLVVYAFCAERFVIGLGKQTGILISSFLGWLLFLAVSVDFALYLLPVVVVFAYVSVRSRSPLGPAFVTGLLMVFFYVYFAASPWILGSRQTGYWLMTAVSSVSALLAGFVVAKVPLRGVSCGENSAV